MGIKGQPLSKEHRRRISESHKGLIYPNRTMPPRTKEHKKNISKAIKKWWSLRKKKNNDK